MLAVATIDLAFYDIAMVNGIKLLIATLIFNVAVFVIAQGNGIFSHRGATHTLWFGALLVGSLYLIGLTSSLFLFASGIAYWSHLLGDQIPLKMTTKPKGNKF